MDDLRPVQTPPVDERPELHVRTRRAGMLTEVYVTAAPAPASATAERFGQIAALLHRLDARLLHERIFAQSDDLERLQAERRTAYGELEDGVAPTWLLSPEGRQGALAGVLVHAIAGASPSALGRHGRLLRWDAGGLITISGLCSGDPGGAAELSGRAEAVFAQANALLRRGGSTPRQLGRTWLWLDRMHACYDDLNRARTRFFIEEGLVGAEGVPVHLPASTGIGVRPAAGPTRTAHLGLDAVASAGGSLPTAWLALGNQGSAFAYGSAFSRASRLQAPGGDTVYVSGTAAVDGAGRTVSGGDAEGQLRAAVDNVRAVLRDLGLREQDVVQGVVYAVSEAVAELWRRRSPTWPVAVVLADICRPDLLLEIEVTACPGAVPR
jgi:enamine deaminase RidA (YjgF/YER057c/UK114 family)